MPKLPAEKVVLRIAESREGDQIFNGSPLFQKLLSSASLTLSWRNFSHSAVQNKPLLDQNHFLL